MFLFSSLVSEQIHTRSFLVSFSSNWLLFHMLTRLFTFFFINSHSIVNSLFYLDLFRTCSRPTKPNCHPQRRGKYGEWCLVSFSNFQSKSSSKNKSLYKAFQPYKTVQQPFNMCHFESLTKHMLRWNHMLKGDFTKAASSDNILLASGNAFR